MVFTKAIVGFFVCKKQSVYYIHATNSNMTTKTNSLSFMVLNSLNLPIRFRHFLPENLESMNAWWFTWPWKVLQSVWKVRRGDTFTLLFFGIHRQAEEGEMRWWHQLLWAEWRGKLSSGRKVYNSVMKDLELTLLSFPCLQPWCAHCAWTDVFLKADTKADTCTLFFFIEECPKDIRGANMKRQIWGNNLKQLVDVKTCQIISDYSHVTFNPLHPVLRVVTESNVGCLINSGHSNIWVAHWFVDYCFWSLEHYGWCQPDLLEPEVT